MREIKFRVNIYRNEEGKSRTIRNIWVVYKVHGIAKFSYFRQSDVYETWLPPFSTTRIINPKVGTVPRKFEKYIRSTNRPAHFFFCKKLCLFREPVGTNIKLI